MAVELSVGALSMACFVEISCELIGRDTPEYRSFEKGKIKLPRAQKTPSE